MLPINSSGPTYMYSQEQGPRQQNQQGHPISASERNEAMCITSQGKYLKKCQGEGQGFQCTEEQYARPDRFYGGTYYSERCTSQSLVVPHTPLSILPCSRALGQEQGARCFPCDGSRHNDQQPIYTPSIDLQLHNRASHHTCFSTPRIRLDSNGSDVLNMPEHPPSSIQALLASKLWSPTLEASGLALGPTIASSSASTPLHPENIASSSPSFPESPNPLQVAQTLASLGEQTQQYDTGGPYGNGFSNDYPAANKSCGVAPWASMLDSLHLDMFSNQPFHCHNADHQAGICDGFKMDWLGPCYNTCDDYICADDHCSSDDCSETDDCVTCHDAVVPCKDACPETPCAKESCIKEPVSSFCQALLPSYRLDSSFASAQHHFSPCIWHSNGSHYNAPISSAEGFDYDSRNGLAERQSTHACELDQITKNASGGQDASRNSCVCLVPNCTFNGQCFKDLMEYKEHFIDVHCHQYSSNSSACCAEDLFKSRTAQDMYNHQDPPFYIHHDSPGVNVAVDAICAPEFSRSEHSQRSPNLSEKGAYRSKQLKQDEEASVCCMELPLQLLASSEEARKVCKIRLYNDSSTLCGATFQNSKDLHVHLETVHSKVKKEEGRKDFVCPWDKCQKRILKLKPHYRTHSGCKGLRRPPSFLDLLTLFKLKKLSAKTARRKYQVRMHLEYTGTSV